MTALLFERDLNLTKAVARSFPNKKVPPPRKHRWTERADGQTGEWRLSPQDVVAIRWVPNVRPHTSTLLFEELGYAESYEEARMLCALIEGGSDGLPEHTRALEAAGFELKPRLSPFCLEPSKYDSWEKTIKGGTFDLTIYDSEFDDAPHADIWCTYQGHGVNHWHNVFRLSGDRRGHDPSFRVRFHYPEQAKDLRAIAVSHLLAVIAARQARPKTRLSTPLGGKLPSQYEYV